jgi:hypothetical protein
MRNVALALLVCACCAQSATAQARNRDRQPQTQQTDSQPSPTPVDNRQTEIDNAAKAERERYEKERDTKEDAFRQEQARQNRVIVQATYWMAVFAGINLLVAGVYAVFAYRTLKAVDKQANHASEQVGKMGDQLTAMERERKVLNRHAEAMFRAARYSKEMLNETRDLVRQNERAYETNYLFAQQQAMSASKQLEAMRDQVKSAREQTEFAAKQIDLMIRNERAYMGIRKINPIGLDGKTDLAVRVTFRNGGKSPAFQFRTFAHVEISVEPPEFKWIEVAIPAKRSFIAATEDRNVTFPCLGEWDIESVITGQKRLYVDGEAQYSTLSGQKVNLCFGATWNDGENEFEVRYQHERVELEVQDSMHGHMADNVTLGEGSKPEPDEGDKNGEKRNPN